MENLLLISIIFLQLKGIISLQIKSLLFFGKTVLVSLLSLVILSAAIFASQYYYQKEIDKHGAFLDITNEETGKVELIFVPYNEDVIFSSESLVVIEQVFTWLKYAAGGTVALLMYLVIWAKWKGSIKAFNEIDDIRHEFIQQSYLLNFEDQIPVGSTKEEKILSHLPLVFPELKKMENKKTTGTIKYPYQANVDISGYSADLVINLGDKGEIVVQFFEKKVTIEVLLEFVKKMNKHVTVFRAVCIGLDFEDKLLGDDVGNYINELKADFDLDLIIQDEKGYSIIWMD